MEKLRESERVELKREVCEGVKRTIVAFANSEGGLIYVGVDDSGQVVGVDEPDADMLRVTSMVRDGICPELLQFVSVREELMGEKRVVVVDVERGDSRPYCLVGKGFTPQGVFLRVGPGNSPASWSQIRRMILDSDGAAFELRRASAQELTFVSARRAFEQNGVAFGRQKFRTLRLVDASGYYTNLALILSDQCPFSVKCAVIDDEGPEYSFQARQECTGSVFDQLEQASLFLNAANRLRSTFEGYVRVDEREYPEQAVRETLLNALVHRDYESAAATLVKVYPRRMQFVSGGGLPEGLTVDDMLRGVSVPRNPCLMQIMVRLGLSEAWGSGVPAVVGAYAQHGLRPTYQPSAGMFFAELPNLNTCERPGSAATGTAQGGAAPVRETYLGRGTLPGGFTYEDYLLEFAQTRSEFTRDDAQRVMGMGRDATLRVINGLLDKGKLERVGQTRAVHYRVVSAS